MALTTAELDPPGLEPYAIRQSLKLSGHDNSKAEDAAMMQAAAGMSLAITLKRFADMAQPFVDLLLAQAQAEAAESKKGKGK